MEIIEEKVKKYITLDGYKFDDFQKAKLHEKGLPFHVHIVVCSFYSRFFSSADGFVGKTYRVRQVIMFFPSSKLLKLLFSRRCIKGI